MSEQEKRAALLRGLQSLVPHEIKCRCGKGGVFGYDLHAEDCPRREVGEMLAALSAPQEEGEGKRLTCEVCGGLVGFVAGMAIHVDGDGNRLVEDHCAEIRAAQGKPPLTPGARP